MIIEKIVISKRTKYKILNKHGIESDEIQGVMSERPLFLKAKNNKYLVIGIWKRYLTIIIKYKRRTAYIITAYQSTETQISLYKRKRKLWH